MKIYFQSLSNPLYYEPLNPLSSMKWKKSTLEQCKLFDTGKTFVLGGVTLNISEIPTSEKSNNTIWYFQKNDSLLFYFRFEIVRYSKIKQDIAFCSMIFSELNIAKLAYKKLFEKYIISSSSVQTPEGVKFWKKLINNENCFKYVYNFKDKKLLPFSNDLNIWSKDRESFYLRIILSKTEIQNFEHSTTN